MGWWRAQGSGVGDECLPFGELQELSTGGKALRAGRGDDGVDGAATALRGGSRPRESGPRCAIAPAPNPSASRRTGHRIRTPPRDPVRTPLGLTASEYDMLHVLSTSVGRLST